MDEDLEISALEPIISAPAPAHIEEYAQNCVRFVLQALGVTLDFSAETLPVLDHYLKGAKKDITGRPEALPLLAAAAGAYIGEVIRRRHPAMWLAPVEDFESWRLDLSGTSVTVYPVAMARDAIAGEVDTSSGASIDLDEEDRQLVSARLEDLPYVSEEDFLAPSTRVEVVDITVDCIRAYQAAKKAREDEGLPEPSGEIPPE